MEKKADGLIKIVHLRMFEDTIKECSEIRNEFPSKYDNFSHQMRVYIAKGLKKDWEEVMK